MSIDEKIKAASGQLLAGRPQITDGRLTVANLCAEAWIFWGQLLPLAPRRGHTPGPRLRRGSGAPDATPRPETEELREQLRQLAKTQTALRSQHAAEVGAARHGHHLRQPDPAARPARQPAPRPQPGAAPPLERAGDNVTALPVPSPAAQGTADR